MNNSACVCKPDCVCVDTIDAVKNRCISCLKRLIDDGCPIDWYAKATAAQMDELDMLEYLYSVDKFWQPFTTSWSAKGGSLRCLKFAHENGAPWRAISAELAVREGHLHCVKYMAENGCPITSDATAQAARYGHLDMLKYLVEDLKIVIHPFAKVWATNKDIIDYLNV